MPAETGGGDSTAPIGPGLTAVSFELRTGSDGFAWLDVPIDASHDSLLVSFTGGAYAGVEQLWDPSGGLVIDGPVWWSSDESLTGAIQGWADTAALVWPLRPEDGELTPGTWRVRLYTLNPAGRPAPADVSGTWFVRTPAPEPSLTLGVDVHFAQGVGTAEVREAVGLALERWAELWADKGWALDGEVLGDIDVPAQMSWVNTGAESLPDALAGRDPARLVVVVGEGYGGGGYEGFQGVAANIPGTLETTRWTWVTVSWPGHAGVDGVLSEVEARWMGETMAHEVGHYLGLFHPVECPYDCGGAIDAIADTPRCDGWRACQDEVGHNLMFPYAICPDGVCWDQTQLSGDQQHVVRGHPALD